MLVKSKYNVEVPLESGELIIYNTLYRSLIRLNYLFAQEYLNKDKLSVGSTYPAELTAFLSKNMILVERDYEKQTIKALADSFFHSNNVIKITFITSLMCNLRCDYCYEEHKTDRFKKEDYDKAIKQILEKDYKLVCLDWFGGEPLLCLSDIEYVTKKVLEKYPADKVSGSMTTNGTLLTPRVLAKLINLRINKFQITIDGTQENHDSHRKYIDGSGSFKTIMNNLRSMKLSEFDFTVIIRINVDKNTDIDSILSYLQNTFGDDSRFYVTMIPISNWGCNLDVDQLVDRTTFTAKATKLIKAYKLQNYSFKNLIKGNMMCNYRIKNMYLFRPDGVLTDCTVNFDDVNLGNCNNLTSSNNKKLTKPLCRKKSCPLYPICFGFVCKNKSGNDKYCKFWLKEKMALLKNTLD